MSPKNKTIQLIELGKMPYDEAVVFQEKLFHDTIAVKRENRAQAMYHPTKNYLLWVEHTPAI